MIIKKPEFVEFSKGGYSVIFCDSEYRYAYKLYKSFEHRDENFLDLGKKVDVNAFLKEVFETEKKAYESVQLSELLKKYTSTFYGTIVIEKVLDDKDNDISNQFLLDCCLKMEFIKGDNIKLDNFQSNPIFEDKIRCLKTEFINHKINYLIDAQVITNGQNFVILDFQTENSMDIWDRKYL